MIIHVMNSCNEFVTIYASYHITGNRFKGEEAMLAMEENIRQLPWEVAEPCKGERRACSGSNVSISHTMHMGIVYELRIQNL